MAEKNGARHGDSIYRRSSVFTGMLGKQVASSDVTVLDDGTITGGFGSYPFDGEGPPSRRTVVVEKGILKNYLLNSYTARKLKMRSTSNAARRSVGNPSIGNSNLLLARGFRSSAEIIRGITKGLFVTELLGQGVNMLTGDYSRGASGIWITNGEFGYPVREITIAGNLKSMFREIGAVGNDLLTLGAVAAPTLCIEGMTISGK